MRGFTIFHSFLSLSLSLSREGEVRKLNSLSLILCPLEKCDAFAGAAKDNCVTAAKSQYGK
jgi:hypothetical protein